MSATIDTASVGWFTPDTPESYATWKAAMADSIHRAYHTEDSPHPLRRELDMHTSNPYVDCVMDESTGAFEQGADPSGAGGGFLGLLWQKLTFDYPTVPWSFSIYKIDGNTPEQQYRTGPDCSALPSSDRNYMAGGAIYTEWDNRYGVKIVQRLEAVSLGASSGDIEQIKYTTMFIPVDDACHNCGCLVYYDVMLNSSDGAPISTSYGYTGTAEIFYAATSGMPSIWRAYEFGYPPGGGDLQSLGILQGFEAVQPDVFWYGNWGASFTNGWDDTFWSADVPTGLGGDSAAMVKWYQHNVCPGDTLSYTTYYGIGQFTELVILLNHVPPTLTAGCAGEIIPDPFNIDAVIVNGGGDDACNVTTTLILPPGLSVATGTSPFILGTLAGSGGTDVITWGVTAAPSVYGTTQSYTIRIEYDDCAGGGTETVEETYNIEIPIPSSLYTDVTADDTLLCIGEATRLHLSYGDGRPPYSYTWYATSGPSIGLETDPLVTPAVTTMYVAYVLDDEGCVGTDTVMVYVSNPIAEAGMDAAMCSGSDPIELGFTPTAYGGIEPYRYTWTPATGLDDPASSNPNASPTTTTMYHLTVVDTAGCVAYDSVLITVSSPVADAGMDTTLCRGSSYTLGGSPTASGGYNPYFYHWQPIDGLDNPSAANPVATPEVTTTYILEIQDSTACFAYDTVVVTVAASPVAELMLPDLCDSITACANQHMIFHVEDTSGSAIDESSIDLTLTVNGVTEHVTTSDSRLTFTAPDELLFEPSPNWEHGDTVVFTLNPVANMAGCLSDPITCSFIVDLEPPALLSTNPADGASVHMPAPSLRMELYDDIAGIDLSILDGSHVTVTVNGTPESGYTVGWDGTYLNITGLSFDDGDSVQICLTATRDTPHYCFPNDTAYCYWFLVSMAGPGAEVVDYLPGSWVACEPESQMVVFRLSDDDGINESTIAVEVFDISGLVTYYIGPELSYDPVAELLFLNPPTSWEDGDVVQVCLVAVEDMDGNPLEEEVCDSFRMDLSPPIITWSYPTDGDILNPDDPATYRVHIDDIYSGVDPDNVFLEACDEVFTPTIVRGDTFIFETGFAFSHFADCSSFCAIAADNPDYCSANVDTGCVEYLLTSGPTGSLISPPHLTISACEDQCIYLLLFDDDLMVVDSTIRLTVEGVEYTTDDPELIYNPVDSTLRFCPSVDWTHGQVVNFSLTRAEDEAGVALVSPVIDSFIVDIEAPVVSGADPAAGDVVDMPNPIVCFDITDVPAGVDLSSLLISIGGDDFDTSHTAITVTGTEICFDPTDAGYFWGGGTVIDFCVTADDEVNPDYCGPNNLDTCWTFEILSGGPVGHIIDYSEASYVACDPGVIVIDIVDSTGVVADSIEFTIDRSSMPGEVTYTVDSAGVTWSEPELSYTPTTPFVDGEVVTVRITKAYDILGNVMESHPSATFTIDYAHPYVSTFLPAEGSILTSPSPSVTFTLDDDGAGIEWTTIEVTIGDETYDDTHPCIDYLSGTVTIDSTCLAFSGCDTISVRIQVGDAVDYCDPNMLDTTITFYMECVGPVPEIVYPTPEDTISCDLDSIMFAFDDDPPGLDWTSIVFEVNGDVITWGAEGLSYDPATRIFTYGPSGGPYIEGMNRVVIRECTDLLGNPMLDTLAWEFLVDWTPPRIWSFDPLCGDTSVPTISPIVEFMAYDDLSGLNTDLLELYIYISGTLDRTVSLADPALSMDDDSTFTLDTYGFGFGGGDTVCIIYSAVDLADDAPFCPPNEDTTECCFVISSGGPVGVILYPENGDYLSCDPDSIICRLEDPDGIIDSTILLSYGIHSCDGELDSFGVDDPRVSWNPATGDLIFHPDPMYENGDTICFSILEADDMLGNAIGRGDQVWFVADYTPPVVLDHSPADGAILELLSPEICVEIYDSLAGVDEATVEMIVDGTTYHIGDAGISWDGRNLCMDAEALGIAWTGGDSIEVTVRADDMVNLCAPNSLDYTFEFSISIGGPIPNVIQPDSGAVVACDSFSIIWSVSDTNGILYETAAAYVLTWQPGQTPDSTHYVMADMEHGFRDITLTEDPFFNDGDSVTACLYNLEDSLHNPMREVSCVTFLVDRTPPAFSGMYPAIGDTILTNVPDVTFTLTDNASGVDPASVSLHIDPPGSDFLLTDPCIGWDEMTGIVTFNPADCGIVWPGSTTVTIEINAADFAWGDMYCGPNTSSETMVFTIAPGPPVAEIVEPLNGTFSSCADQQVFIDLRDFDAGVDHESIELTVNGTHYNLDSPELEYIGDTLLVYTNHSLWNNGDVVHVTLDHACDLIDNCADDLLDFTFTIDIVAPVFELVQPAGLLMLRDNEQDIEISLSDPISGIDESSILFTVNETPYELSEIGWSHDTTTGEASILFQPEDHGIRFVSGDTVCFHVMMTDTTEYCADNELDTTLCFTLEPNVSCYASPNPFSPNGDSYNNMTFFEYPEMFTKPATLRVFSKRKELIRELEIGPATSMSDYDVRNWDGKDKNGILMTQGMYIYTVEVGGEIVCKGTIVLIR